MHPVGGLGVCCVACGGIFAGFLVGTLHAWLITSVRLPPFVATLATLVGLRSFARAMCEYITTSAGRQRQYRKINVNDAVFRYLRDIVWVSATVFAVLAVVTWVMLSRTVLGRHIYALGRQRAGGAACRHPHR